MADRPQLLEVERRQATALFIDISGFTALSERLDPEEVRSVVQGLLALFAEIVERQGGSVHLTIGDCILALFGIPTAMEGAALAAVNAAIEMHAATPGYSRERSIDPPLSVHTGIQSGLIVTGSGLVQQIEVTGDTVNVASRLKDGAPAGSIWIGEATYRQVRGHFAFRELEPMELKGKQGRTRVYEVISRAVTEQSRGGMTGSSVASTLVGRDRELARLRARLQDLAAGRGGVVRLVGEAGFGKSRLLAEARASAEGRAVVWLEGRSLPTGANRAFHTFADLLRAWLNAKPDESSEETLARLERALDDLVPEDRIDVLPFVASILGLRLAGTPLERLTGIGGEALENLTVRSMVELLDRLAARRPTLLCFDDLHWADVSSLDLLATLLRLAAGHPLLFVLALRPDARDAPAWASTASELMDAGWGETIALTPLDRAAAAALIGNLFRGGDLPPAARRSIEERAGGNPFYIVEIVRSLVEQGAVERRGGALFVTRRFAQISLPTTVDEVIMTRLHRIDPAARSVIQVAAILGRSAPTSVLEGAIGRESLSDELATLREANLLVPAQRSGGVVYEFAHPLIQEVTYQAISNERRRELHRRIARTIEGIWSERDPGYHAMLAYHFAQARDSERAAEHLARACDEGGASTEALQFLEEAAQILVDIRGESDDAAPAAAIHKKLAFAYLGRGMMIEGNEHLHQALVLLGQRGGTSGRGRPWRLVTAAASVMADLWLARDPTKRPPASDRECEIIQLIYAGAQAQVTTDPTGFLFNSMAGLRRLSRVDPRSVEGAGGIYAGAVGFLAYAGLPPAVGRRLLQRAERFVNADDPRELFGYRVFGFIHHLLAGDWDERHAIEPALIEENLRLGELWLVINYLPLDAKRRAHQGRFAEAAEELEQIEKIGQLYGYDLARSNELAVRMFLQLERGDLTNARATARAHYEGFDEDLLNLFALGHEARIEMLLGDLASAEDSLGRARRIVERTAFVPPFHASAYWVGCLALAIGQLEAAVAQEGQAPAGLRRRAARAGRRALSLARRVAWERPVTLRLLGSGAWLAGRRDRALRRWSAAIAEAERLDMQPELGRIWLEAGRSLSRDGKGQSLRELDADGCLATAERITERLALADDAATRSLGRSG
jgi:class 3 adenylate cyclase